MDRSRDYGYRSIIDSVCPFSFKNIWDWGVFVWLFWGTFHFLELGWQTGAHSQSSSVVALFIFLLLWFKHCRYCGGIFLVPFWLGRGYWFYCLFTSAGLSNITQTLFHKTIAGNKLNSLSKFLKKNLSDKKKVLFLLLN